LEREFQKALERNRQQLDERRARIKHEAAVQRGSAGIAAEDKNTTLSRGL
jgi:hypothetical protein